MSTFAAQRKDKPAPLRIVTLEPSAWAKGAPKTKVALGLRCLSHRELTTAQGEAWKEARSGGREGEEVTERFNEVLMAWTVAYACTDPNDASKPYFEFAHIEVREKLRPETIRRLWDELEAAQAGSSPLLPPADDDELAELGAMLCGQEPLGNLTPAQALRLRRWARLMLEQLVAAEASG